MRLYFIIIMLIGIQCFCFGAPDGHTLSTHDDENTSGDQVVPMAPISLGANMLDDHSGAEVLVVPQQPNNPNASLRRTPPTTALQILQILSLQDERQQASGPSQIYQNGK